MNSVFINGQWHAGNGDTMCSVNPGNLQTLWQKSAADFNQVKAAVTAARRAQPDWQARTLEQRIAYLTKFAAQLQQHQSELAHCISLETGKPLWESLAEVSAMINKISISIDAYEQRTGEHLNGNLALSHRPHGVMAVFGPYNFPGHLPNGHIVPALLAGNTVVFKPSEETPWVAEKTLQLWQASGLPDGVVNLVQGGREIGVALCQQDINGLLFTGSSNTGRRIHQQFAGRPEVLLALEMGGNNALIVDDQANPDSAAQWIVRSAFISAGQRCTCARRLIVIDSGQADTLLQQTMTLARRLTVAAPSLNPNGPIAQPAMPSSGQSSEQPSCTDEAFMGPVINRSAMAQLLQAQQQLLNAGGVALLTMKHLDPDSCLLSPGIIDMTATLTNGQTVADEEWFGPLLQLYRVASFDQAMTLANTTRFGLAAGLISDKPAWQRTFAEQIRAGVIAINQPTAGAASTLPFGGIGASGNHRPSAWYAADYCAWPQAASHGPASHEAPPFSTTGIRS